MAKKTKYIFVSGGVISGIGKGITTASISTILQSRGFKISPVKIDMYLNVDAGTIRPQEHGEVFVTDDGTETDQDLGHYERFLDTTLTKSNYITTGQVYKKVIDRERSFEYDGEDVEAIPHVTDEIIRRIKEAGRLKEADIVIVELGGTVGEYQNSLFFEASRILQLKYPGDVAHVHVTYLPIPKSLGEMKSKPAQQSVKSLNGMGIQPDILVGRSELPLDKKRKERLALFCNIQPQGVISNPDVDTIYEVPLILSRQNIAERLFEKLNLPSGKEDLSKWQNLVDKIHATKNEVKIALVGKYFATGDFQLEDVYVSVIEALKHAGWENNVSAKLFWVDSEDFEKGKSAKEVLGKMDGIVVPGGFGVRGIEGILKAIKFARETKKPYLGLCYGMQLASVEFARNVAHMPNANTEEIDKNTPHPIIHLMPKQEKLLIGKEYGGTMRLGSYPCKFKKGSLAMKAYGKERVDERHRHRFEFNNKYRDKLEKEGLVVSGTSLNGKLVEMIELNNHPFFVGTQFHPEFKSRPLKPHPLYVSFIKACIS